jgi:hypothetical protein
LAALFILVEVRYGRTIGDFPHTCCGAGGKQQSLHKAGFTGALVAYQGNIPQVICGIFLHSVEPPHMSVFKREEQERTAPPAK